MVLPTSYLDRNQFSENRYPRGHFWSPGKFYRSVGNADLETVTKYVQDQRLFQTTLHGSTAG
ncbi:MAG: transposase [Candidatus Thermoplasmatota archaeon]